MPDHMIHLNGDKFMGPENSWFRKKFIDIDSRVKTG